jgi:hypothetical protein
LVQTERDLTFPQRIVVISHSLECDPEDVALTMVDQRGFDGRCIAHLTAVQHESLR